MAYPYYPYYPNWSQYGMQQPVMPYNAFNSQTSNVHAPSPINAQNATNGFTWVQGVEGAKAYVVPAGVSALLMDSEKERFYIKGSDASGMPLPLRVFEYKEIKEDDSMPSEKGMDRYVTKDEFEKFKSEIRGVTNEQFAVSGSRRYEYEQDGKSLSDAPAVEKRPSRDAETGRADNSRKHVRPEDDY